MSDSIDRLFSFPIGRREPLKRGVYVVKYGDGTSGDEEPAIPDTGVFRARLHAALAAWVGTKAGKRAATARSGRITIRHLSGLLDDADFRPSLLAQLKAQGILHLDVIDYDEHELVDDWFVDDDLLAPEEKKPK